MTQQRSRPDIACDGKVQLTPTLARQIARKKRRNDVRMQPYHCPHCGQWHIGSRAQPKNTSRRPRPTDNDEE